MDRLHCIRFVSLALLSAGSLLILWNVAQSWPSTSHRSVGHVDLAQSPTAGTGEAAGYTPNLLRLPANVLPLSFDFDMTAEHATVPASATEIARTGRPVIQRLPIIGALKVADTSAVRSQVPAQTAPPTSGASADDSTPALIMGRPDAAETDEAVLVLDPADSGPDDSLHASTAFPALEAESPIAIPKNIHRLPPLSRTLKNANAKPGREVKTSPTTAGAASGVPASTPDGNSATSHVADSAPSVAPRPPRNLAMAAVAGRADSLIRHGFSLGERGAYYSARADFIQALRLISQALDAAKGGQEHSQALADGLQALTEADAFVPKGSRLEADLNVSLAITAHQTPVLKQTDAAELSPLVALQRYYTYAQEQLAEACGNEPTASMALYGMGKIHTLLARRSGEFETLHGPKAMAMHQAALLVDPNNYRAANELGVLLARYSQLDDARRVLLHSLSIYPQAESWHNLSVVHERLGENDLARRARYEWQLVRERRNGVAVADNTVESPVQWVDSNTFARISSASRGQNEPPPPTQPPAEKKVGATWWMPWKKATR